MTDENRTLPPSEPTIGDDIRAAVSKYSHTDTLFALASLVLGWIFVRFAVMTYPAGVGMSLFTLLCSAAYIAYIRLSHRRLSREGMLWCISSLVFGSVPSYVTGEDTASLALFMAAMSFLMLCVRGTYTSNTGYILLDAVCAPFKPFAKFFSVLPSLAVPFVSKDIKSRTFALTLGGIAIAAVPTCAAVFLLMRADAAFEGVMDRLLEAFTWDRDDIASNTLCLILALPCGHYIFGVLHTAAKGRVQNADDREKCRSAVEGFRIASPLLVCAALAPLCLVYIVFFISQAGYFLSGFASLVPEGYSASEYARRGFFELCKVAAINAGVIFAAMLFSKPGKAVRVFITLLAALTSALAVTALAKLMLYIDLWGLTVNRLYPAVFMAVLIACFALLIMSLYRPIRLLSLCCAISIAAGAALICADPERIVGRYNAARYADGSLDHIDLSLYSEMSPAAAEYLIPLADDEEYGSKVLLVLYIKYYEALNRGDGISEWAHVSLGALRCVNMFEKYAAQYERMLASSTAYIDRSFGMAE